jgi:hypothetical protein
MWQTPMSIKIEDGKCEDETPDYVRALDNHHPDRGW